MDFISILAKSLSGPLLKKVAEYLEIQKGELKDKDFEKFYKTFVQHFLKTQKGLHAKNAKEYFYHDVTYDGVLAYLYRLTEPEPDIKNYSKDALIRWSQKFSISAETEFSNSGLVEQFLFGLENELRQKGDKGWLPHFKDVRTDIANLDKKIEAVLERLQELPSSPSTTGPIWHVPHRRNPSFTGREDILSELHQILNADGQTALTQTQTIKGLGGVGKTQIALEYAYRHKEDYQTVWWVRAETAVTLTGDYFSFARAAGLPEQEAQEQHLVMEAVQRWFNQNSGWLLIFDNVPDPETLKDIAPTSGTGHILITSCYQSWLGVAHTVSINIWPREESIAFLCKRTGQDDEARADTIAEALGDLPLALAQAAAYMESRSKSHEDYLKLYESRRKELWEKEKPTGDYPETVATTWNIAIEEIKNEAPAGMDILSLCAYLAPDDIPRQFFNEENDFLPDALRDPLAIDDGIEALNRYSLIELLPETLSVHRLVQTVVRDALDAEKKKFWIETAVATVDALWPRGTFDVRSWSQCEQMMPHSKVCVGHTEEHAIESVALAQLLNRMGFYLNDRAVYTDAEPFYRRALAIWEAQLGKDHPLVATCLNNLAELLRNQGKYEDAEPLYRRALEIREDKLGQDHPDVANSLNNLGLLLQAQGKYEDAEPLHRRALKIVEAQLGKDHPHVATCLINLAGLLKDKDKYEDAEPLYRRALKIRENKLGKDHPDVATSLNNLAELLRAQGKYEDAEPLYRRALKIGETQLGKDHPNVATGLNNLALLLSNQGKYEDAEPLFRRALEIYETQLGRDHPNTATCRENLAALMDEMQSEKE